MTITRSLTHTDAMVVKKPNILVIDDLPDNLRLLSQVLTAQGYRVRPAITEALALTAAQLDPPDLILLDIKMPGMGGYELCKRFKADARTCNVPVIFLTVLDDVVAVKKGFELGGVDYITKPFRTGELLARIDNQIRLRSLQKQLIEKEQFLRTVYNGIAAAITLVDVLEDGTFRIAQVNETALELSGRTRQELEGIDVQALFPPETIRSNCQACVEQGLPVTYEIAVQSPTGEKIWLLTTHTPIRNAQGNVVQLLATSINITARKQAEMQLAGRTQELSNALETIKATQGELVRTAKMAALGNLVAGVAHEINTPVGTAIMSASTMHNCTEKLAADLQTQGMLDRTAFEDYLDLATECSYLVMVNLQRAGELIQTFKQVAVDETSLQQRTFALKPYIREVIYNLTPEIKSTPHRITLSGDDAITLHSYPGAFAQIITNLVVNSLTHAYPDNRPGNLHIAIHECPTSHGEGLNAKGNSTKEGKSPRKVIIKYTDNGCGIPETLRSRIFEPFFTTMGDQGGSGLGLHLVYNLVTQKLRGTIDVSTACVDGSLAKAYHGTKFIITVPN